MQKNDINLSCFGINETKTLPSQNAMRNDDSKEIRSEAASAHPLVGRLYTILQHRL